MSLRRRPRADLVSDIPPAPSFLQEAFGFVWELVKVIAVSLAIILPIRYFLIQPFYVKGASMEPNFADRQYLIIDELTYRFRPPRRGEVVVFRYPLNPRDYFIKRVIGQPGEQVRIADGRIYLTPAGHPVEVQLEEPYLPAGLKVDGAKTTLLGPDEFFLLGDNRSESLDSRYFGPVNFRFIIGRVLMRGWPFDRINLFLEPPEYNIP